MLKRIPVVNCEAYCPTILPSQLSHSELSDTICFKKAAAEMMRRDTRNPEVVYKLRNERQDHHGHDEGQSDEFQQTPAELRQHVGDQIQKIFMKRPEMRMPVLHQKFLVYKLEKFNWPPETRQWEIQGQWLPLHQENDRINALMNQIQITHSSVNTKNQELAQQVQTSNLELSRLQIEVSYLRTSVARNPSTERRDAENLRQLSDYKNQEKETARAQAPWADAHFSSPKKTVGVTL